MRSLRQVALLGIVVGLGTTLTGCEDPSKEDKAHTEMSDKVVKTDEAWKTRLTPEQYRILRTKGTERAFTGTYWNHTGEGVYRCAGCGQELFSSQTKFKSGTGWPSFTAPLDTKNVTEAPDTSLSMKRTEVLCSRCGGHLGHVFNDGPEPTGRRYCINSAALDFVAKDEGADR